MQRNILLQISINSQMNMFAITNMDFDEEISSSNNLTLVNLWFKNIIFDSSFGFQFSFHFMTNFNNFVSHFFRF